LVSVYFCGMLYYSLHYPAKFAFIQQLFDRSQYQALIGLLEVQGQTAMMLAGGLGGFMVARGVPLPTILLIDASTYAFSFAVLSGLPKDLAPALTATASPAARRTWKMVADGWRWLQERPRLNLFLLCSLMPFIAVMAANYLFPVYVAQVLKADARVFGWGEITFAAGAIVAGALLPRLIAHRSAYRTIGATFVVFMAGLLLVSSVPTALFYLLAGAFLGFGNAGCRVARNALMLNLVPNEVMGRVNVFYNVFDRLMRTLLVAALGIIDVAGAKAGFLLLLAVTALAYLGVVRSRESIRTDLPAAAVPTS
jgi:MFS family permease